MRRGLAALLACAALAGSAARAEEIVTIDRAEITLYEEWGRPDEGVPWTWRQVDLPHNWYRDPPPASLAWYRLRITLAPQSLTNHGIYMPRLPVRDLAVYVNSKPVWRLTERNAIDSTISAVLIPIPPDVLRAGENVIHVRMHGSARWFHGLPRIYFGSARVLSERAAVRNLLQGQVIYMTALALGAIGLLSLLLWVRTGWDPVLFWYGVTGVVLLLATALWFLTLWRDDLGAWRTALIFMRFNGYLTPLLILHLRLAGRRHPWLEAALWAALAIALVSASYPSSWQWLANRTWSILFAALPALFVIPLLRARGLRRQPTVILLALADAAAALLNLHDWALRLGWVDFDRPYLIYYVAPFVMLAAGAPILQRLLAGFEATRSMNIELEQRVAAKAREIEQSHARLRQIEQEQALADERRRIMADMHDGLGSRLVGLLSVAQSGKAEASELGDGIAAALEEMRMAIDSLEPVEGDVGVVLGNVRHRMRSVFERAGVRFLWNVSELPRLDTLTPARILAIQRLLLEVFTNAIKHSAASTVAVFTARVPGAVHIVIEDDGRGFVPGEPGAGHGLHNLELRAQQAGGTLTVESKPAKGTRVILSLPVNGDSAGEGTSSYPVQGISTAPSSA